MTAIRKGMRPRAVRRGGLRLLALAAAPLALAACTIERADVRTPSGEPPEADTAQVRKVVDEIARAFERGDLASLDTLYHDSVTVFEGANVDKGWLAYRDGHLAPELEVLVERRMQISDLRARLAGSSAWVTFSYRLAAVSDGQPVAARGVGTMVLRKLGGRWRVVHSHTSSVSGG